MVLSRMHENGVLHGDFRPSNVLYSPKGPVIIDFSHSEADHVCPPGSPCPELEFAKVRLNLKDTDTMNTVAMTIGDLYALSHRLTAGFRIAKFRGMAGTTASLVSAMAAFSLIS
jgi:serine/threonine protein kinase